MQDAYGGIVNFMFLAIFLALAIGLLSFVVSYTRAFKMKNAIISKIEEYEGAGCGANAADPFPSNSECASKIEKEAEKLNYNQHNCNCDAIVDGDNTSFKSYKGMFCYAVIEKKSGRSVRVVTQVDINFPIVSNLMSMDFFQISGDSEAFYVN